MGAPSIIRTAPVRVTTPLEKLEVIGTAFRQNLEHIRGLATGIEPSELRDLSAQSVKQNGSPKKHVIAAAFACCASRLAELFGPVRWRCAVSGNREKSKVKAIVNSVNEGAHEVEEAEWPKILEFMHDFSASNRSLTELIGKLKGIDENWIPGVIFKQLLAVESELNGKSLNARRHLVCRDLIKLCLAQSELKVIVYPGYENGDNRSAMLSAFFQTIERCYAERPIPGEWLFIGLLGAWPQHMSVYFHVLNSIEHRMELKNW